MSTKLSLAAVAAVVLVGAVANAGVITFNIANTDAASGIDASKTYTAKTTFGSDPVTVNGVTFDGVVQSGPTGNIVSAPGITANAVGAYPEWKNDAEDMGFPNGTNIADGGFKNLVTQFRYTSAQTDSTAYVLSDLVAGTTYDLRVYGRLWTFSTRTVSLDFTGDGATTNYTFNEDGTADGWFVSHVFTYDGASTPGFTVSTNNFHAYGLSNEVVVPEPASLGLLSAAGLLLGRRRRA